MSLCGGVFPQNHMPGPSYVGHNFDKATLGAALSLVESKGKKRGGEGEGEGGYTDIVVAVLYAVFAGVGVAFKGEGWGLGGRGTYCYLTVHWAVLKRCRSFPGTPYK